MPSWVKSIAPDSATLRPQGLADTVTRSTDTPAREPGHFSCVTSGTKADS